jgi:hypothetical protein
LSRTVKPLADDREGWLVRDAFEQQLGQAGAFTVHWQFAPESLVERVGERLFRVVSGTAEMTIEIGDGWTGAELWQPDGSETKGDLDGIVSPRFMKTTHAPYLKLAARPVGVGEFTTSFLAG